MTSDELVQGIEQNGGIRCTQQAAKGAGEPDFSEERHRPAGVARNRGSVSADEPPALAAGILRYGREQSAGLLVSEREQSEVFTAIELGDDTRRPSTELSGSGVEQDRSAEGPYHWPTMPRTRSWRVRPAEEADRLPLALLFAAVAEERDGIAAEPPIDVDKRAANWDLDRTLVALAAGEVVGLLFVIESSFGFGEIGMMVAANWRGRGVGTALVAAAIEWARARGLHKLTLSVFPHNAAAIGLYRKFGFVEEGRLAQHIRRDSGELWDLIEMGLLL